MKQVPKKTGDFGIGQMIHSVHMTDDVRKLTKFYEEVFGALTYMGLDEPNYLPPEDRWATLVLFSDLSIEPMAPNTPVNPQLPVGKFFTKFGRHLHSAGYHVDDLFGLGNYMIGQDVYIGAPGGGQVTDMKQIEALPYFYPSPKATNGLMIELCALDMPDDPRLLDTWSSQVKMWELGHPLTMKRLQYLTLAVKDLDEATNTYVKALQAIPVAEGLDDGEACRYQVVHLGDCLIRLAQPLDANSKMGQHVEKWGSTIYGITMKVADLDSAEAWLAKKNIRTSRLRPDLVAADPEDCFGAPYFFTTEVIPGDPFDA